MSGRIFENGLQISGKPGKKQVLHPNILMAVRTMPACVSTAIASLQVIFLRKDHSAVLEIPEVVGLFSFVKLALRG
jgi:hypothetical protein